MAQQTTEKSTYLAAFERFEKSLNGQLNAPVHALRRKAIARFEELDFPTTREEAWRFTSVAPIARTRFEPAPAYTGDLSADAVAPYRLGGTHLVFVNGQFAPDLSIQERLPAGVRVTDMADLLDSDPVSGHLGRHVSFETHAFTALNTAFIRDGALVHIPRNTVVESPIHLLFISTASDIPTVSHPRVLILADANSQATIVETYAGLGDTPYFTNAVTEIVAGDNAIIDHYKIELESPQGYHIATMQTRQGRTSNLSTHSISLGGALVRNNVNALLSGEGCEATVNGFYFLNGEQHVDNHTLIEHAEPNCASHELYKGILDERAHGVFRGRIYVHKKAQKTDAYQANQNILLSDTARINTKPQLEIYADDVKCSHGATVGQLNPDAIFYLRSRGIDLENARQILIEAFAGDILSRIKVEPVRDHLQKIITRKFTQIRQGRNAP